MLVVADLSAIENRVLAWLSGCESMLEIYEKDLDPYVDFATRFLNREYDQVTKAERQLCKPAVLGCGYGLGAGQQRVMTNGSKQWTGLMAYAASMGVNLRWEDSSKMVRTFRDTFHEVPQYWRYMEEAFYAATKTKKRQQVGEVVFGYSNGATYIELPVGRRIHYLNPRSWQGEKGIEIRYDGLRNGQWWTVTAWGGVLTENVVQAVSRDVLVEGMLRAEGRGLKIVGHCHDEIIAETSGPSSGLDQLVLEQCMSEAISWAPGLPLAAEGWEGERYAKG